MKRKITEWYMEGQRKLMAWKEGFLRDETGAIHMVEIILVLVIVIAVATIFKTQLLIAVELIMKKLTEFIG